MSQGTNMTPEVMEQEAKMLPQPELKPEIEPKQKTIAGLPVLTAGDLPDLLKTGIFGDPGVGKTLLAATAQDVERLRPVLFIDVEGGAKTFKHKYPTIEIIQPRDRINKQGVLIKYGWDVFCDVVEKLTTDTEHTTVVVDSISELYALAMQKIMKELVTEKDWRDEDIPDRKEWAKASAQMAKEVRKLIHLPKHIILTALRDTRTTEDGKVVVAHTPVLAGKLAFRIAGFLNELLYLSTETQGGKITRKLLSQPANKYIAKTRDDRLPTVLTNPTMADIVKYVLD